MLNLKSPCSFNECCSVNMSHLMSSLQVIRVKQVFKVQIYQCKVFDIPELKILDAVSSVFQQIITVKKVFKQS